MKKYKVELTLEVEEEREFEDMDVKVKDREVVMFFEAETYGTALLVAENLEKTLGAKYAFVDDND